jgi:1-acyl-sn-glycerol-3-phosphate acyltransferase
MLLYYILKYIGYLLFRLFFNMKIYGVDNIPKYGSVIVASNHLSYLDPVVLGIAARRKLNFVAKEELFDYFLFGDLISFVGAFPLGKKGVESAKAIKEAIRRLRKGKAVVIFPEGTRSLTGKIQKGT